MRCEGVRSPLGAVVGHLCRQVFSSLFLLSTLPWVGFPFVTSPIHNEHSLDKISIYLGALNLCQLVVIAWLHAFADAMRIIKGN